MDIMVGAFLLNEAYVVFANPYVEGFTSIANLTTGSDLVSEGNVSSWFGFSGSGCNGDFNGDGIPDFIIGAPGEPRL
jgi:hypothetical protein